MSTAEQPSGHRWYCVKTQPKREHFAAGQLRHLEGVEVFCPRLRYRKATRRGKIWWVEALFPGYVLARFDFPTMHRLVAHTQTVRGIVQFGTDAPAVPDDFVEILRAEIARHDAEQQIHPEMLTVTPQIEAGEEVELAHGPLGGFQGKVIEVLPAHERVKVLLDFLGQPQVVEVDLFSLILPRRPLP